MATHATLQADIDELLDTLRRIVDTLNQVDYASDAVEHRPEYALGATRAHVELAYQLLSPETRDKYELAVAGMGAPHLAVVK